MAQTCTVCRHRRRESIDEALIAGEPIRDVARRHKLTHSAVGRHRVSCVHTALVSAESERVESLAESWRDLHERARRILSEAEKAKDHKTALNAIREVARLLDLAVRAADLRSTANTTADIHEHPSWPSLVSLLLRALQGHPDALADVRAVLESSA